MLRCKYTTLLVSTNVFLRPALAHARQLGTVVATDDYFANGTSGPSVSLTNKMRSIIHQHDPPMENWNISIYRVPSKLRNVQPRAYDPRFVSIGPYHHGSSPELQASEKLKQASLKRLLGVSGRSGDDRLDKLIGAIEAMKHEAQDYYDEDIQVSEDEFVEMMLLDGCFIVDLLRNLQQSKFEYSSILPKRWMLPVVRRDLILVENQIPLMVLKKIFDETLQTSRDETSLEELALNFFQPFMPRKQSLLEQSIADITNTEHDHQSFKHLLDLYHSSIIMSKVNRSKEPYAHWGLSDLKDSGIKVKISKENLPLQLTFKKGVLEIPPLRIRDISGSFFRNVMAYEQCHPTCYPDLTAYIVFLVRLINTADDVAILNKEGIIKHCLGSDQQVADLINDLCYEVEHDGRDSYLSEVVYRIESYVERFDVKAKAKLKQAYFTNIYVTLSTLAGFFLIYLTFLQASHDAIIAKSAKDKHPRGTTGAWGYIHSILLEPHNTIMDIFSGSA